VVVFGWIVIGCVAMFLAVIVLGLREMTRADRLVEDDYE